MDYKLINNIKFDGIDHKDAPDYCDAYIVSAEYNGEDMTEDEIDKINEDRDYVHEMLIKYLH